MVSAISLLFGRVRCARCQLPGSPVCEGFGLRSLLPGASAGAVVGAVSNFAQYGATFRVPPAAASSRDQAAESMALPCPMTFSYARHSASAFCAGAGALARSCSPLLPRAGPPVEACCDAPGPGSGPCSRFISGPAGDCLALLLLDGPGVGLSSPSPTKGSGSAPAAIATPPRVTLATNAATAAFSERALPCCSLGLQSSRRRGLASACAPASRAALNAVIACSAASGSTGGPSGSSKQRIERGLWSRCSYCNCTYGTPDILGYDSRSKVYYVWEVKSAGDASKAVPEAQWYVSRLKAEGKNAVLGWMIGGPYDVGNGDKVMGPESGAVIYGRQNNKKFQSIYNSSPMAAARAAQQNNVPQPSAGPGPGEYPGTVNQPGVGTRPSSGGGGGFDPILIPLVVLVGVGAVITASEEAAIATAGGLLGYGLAA